ncbi:MAG: tRNA (adenosine(37)-N6)-threonylcarbamoyltransferase complex ATPase subunit type 1 TsaE [Ktedonobacteraceae bacterium]
MLEGSLATGNAQGKDALTVNILSHSSAQTQLLGMHLGKLLRGGELLLLEGSLGMGKTTFTQGLAQGLGITATITSPTFTLLKEYLGQVRRTQDAQGPALYHFDLYRLDDPEEIFDLGFEDYFYDTTGVCVVEWADKADGLWVPETLRIAIDIRSKTERTLLFTATGTRYHELLRQFQKNTHVITRT